MLVLRKVEARKWDGHYIRSDSHVEAEVTDRRSAKKENTKKGGPPEKGLERFAEKGETGLPPKRKAFLRVMK